MVKKCHNCNPEVWGGIECTINRTKNGYKDQLKYSRHYTREDDIDKIAELGIKKLRYPVLWEFHKPGIDTTVDWSFTEKQLERIRSKNIEPIAGLIHHGSGPLYTHLLDEHFSEKLAAYAHEVASRFPWIEYYTPVNEPLTTARFSGLYGFWYPHHSSDVSFAKMLLNQVKAVVLSMKAIRKINRNAKLIQTEDLGKTYSTSYLQFQANFENERRWLTFDLLCGKVNPQHTMWKYFTRLGIDEESLQFFLDNPCPPDIMGFNYYITSERYLDENIKNYPASTHGGNEIQVYADVEAVRVKHGFPHGLNVLLKEAWKRFGLPIAITEAHLNSNREEQLKWFYEVWCICKNLKTEQVDIRAVTVWSLLGAFGWNRLLTSPKMDYEPGVFDIRSGSLRKTALAELVKTLASDNEYVHPVLDVKGWWHRDTRFPWLRDKPLQPPLKVDDSRPILIFGKTGTLGKAFARLCTDRAISYRLLGREDADITNQDQIENTIRQHNPWAIINAAGYVKVDEAEDNIKACFDANTIGAEILAIACKKFAIQYITFSSDLIFDGKKQSAYYENDPVNPLNIYGESKAQAEQLVLKVYPEAMVVRTSAFFSPWDNYNFIKCVLDTLVNQHNFVAADDVFVSPAYVPDLVNVCIDLLIDKEKGIWHLTNKGKISWAQLAITAAQRANLDVSKIIIQNSSLMNWKARRPKYSVLKSLKGNLLPTLKNALDRYFHDVDRVKEKSHVSIEI
jgi:dTDP-4-dehydrorhamnose reductase